MKRFKIIRMAVILLVMLPACLLAPATSHAVAGRSNDNHTDTTDYCLRANDVTIQLNEFSTKSRSQLESEIISASNFLFRIRNDAIDFSLWTFYSGSCDIDFSALTSAVTTSGYVVTVTLPAIAMSTPSQISFRVFVEDHSRTISYFFISNTDGRSLPPDVLTRQPAATRANPGDVITPDASFSPVRDGAGVWTFAGWSPSSQTVDSSDVSFYGGWSWSSLPVHSIHYRFISTNSSHSLPSTVLAKLPSDTTGIAGEVITAPGSYHSVEISDGYWRFVGWDAGRQTISDSDIVFTGTWRWRSNSAPAAGTPEPTGSVSPTAETPLPSVTPTLAPETPAPTPLEIQVLEQTDNGTPPQAGASANGDGAGGGAGTDAVVLAAQIAVAGALGSLVATQSVGMVGDFKVLNWYNRKKTARRAK